MEEERNNTVKQLERTGNLDLLNFIPQMTNNLKRLNAPVTLKDNTKLSSSSSLKKNSVDPIKTLKKVPDLIRGSVSNLRPNNKENYQKRANQTLSKDSQTEYSYSDRPSVDPKLKRFYLLTETNSKPEAKVVFNGKLNQDINTNYKRDCLYKTTNKQQSYAIPNIYDQGVSEAKNIDMK